MGKYLFAYRGGGMAQSDAERQEAMARWGSWFQDLGQAVVDMGAPVGASTVVGAADGGSKLSGYSIVSASDLGAAQQLAEGCPVLSSGGSVDVYETMEM
jgi:hypothetical protein